MADIDEALVAELKKDSNLESKLRAGSHWYIFPLLVPDGYLNKEIQDYFLTYTFVDGPEDPNIDLQKPTLQFNCFATSYSKAKDLGKDIKRIFTRFKGTLGDIDHNYKVYNFIKTDEVALYDDTSELYYRPIRFTVLFLGDNV
ncbi:MAG: hypothetical protein WC648_04060 [Candidatus Paceibacterota bacterium]|jgi:hypothetical protein